MLPLDPFDLVALCWAQVVFFVGGLASFRALRGRLQFRPQSSGPIQETVLLVRPCAGEEPLLREALASSRVLSTVAPHSRVVFALASRQDGAFRIAQEVQHELSAAGVEAELFETLASTANAKSGQLAAVVARRPGEILVFADSDVELEAVSLRALIEAARQERVGAAWVPPAEVAVARTQGDRCSQALLSASLHAFPMVSGIDEQGLVGKLFALRRSTLEAVGGFESLGDVLGEDMELARRLRLQGLRIEVIPLLARSLACGRSMHTVVERFTRWLQVIRSQRPSLLLSYPFLFFATLPLLGTAAWCVKSPTVGWAMAVLAVLGRLQVAWVGRLLVANKASRGGIWVDTMMADGLLMKAFFRAISRKTVEWRGRSLALTEGGRLVSRAAQAALPLALALWLGATSALALPAVGDMGKNVNLEDADGKIVKMESLVGKPILIVYEDKESTKMNQSFKDELSKLAKGDKYRDKVALAAVADVTAYNYWPVKGFVKDSIREESKKLGTPIFCDWDGHVRVSFTFRKKTSSIVLLNKQGRVIFAAEGKLSSEQRQKAVELLKAEVEG
ncbi:MAG: glycosyltransferase [Polyangiaceae bacterium]|nr:glycosyltransferase [Polyangiaceae bacterium]